MKILFCAALISAAAAQKTACQECCSPGGDCSRAYKGAAGKCCGDVNGQSFCCPGSAGAPGAKCYDCGSTYRCYTGFSSRNICGAGHAHQTVGMHAGTHHSRRHSEASTGYAVMLGVFGVLCVIWCARRRYDGEEYATKVVYGHPVGGACPGYSQPMMPVGMQPGYSGGAVAGGAAAGFVGGYMLSSAMDAGRHHGGYGGGDYGECGGDFGGGDFGGGDGGFAADS